MKTLLGYIEKVLEWGTILTLSAICIVVGIQVVGRYIFRETPFWTEETARFLFIYLVMFGAGLAVKHKAYVNLDVVTHLLPARGQMLLALLVDIVIIAFMVIFLANTVPLVEKVSLQQSPVLQINMSYPYAALFGIGGGILLFAALDCWEIVVKMIKGGVSQ